MRILFVLLSLVLGSMLSQAKTIEVCKSCAITTIDSAYTLAKDGDEVKIKQGVYDVQEFVIEKAITLSGELGVIIDGGGKTILYVHHSDVTIQNIQLQNVETKYVEDRAALKCKASDNLVIENITVRQSFFGIMLEDCRNGKINNCDVKGEANAQNYLESSNGNAIHLWYCKNMTITNNQVTNHRDGIYFEFVENSTILNNYSEGNMRYGLHFMFSHENLYEGNTFSKNGAGVAVMYSDHVIMRQNKFINNWGESSYGLLLKDITDSKLTDNAFINNTIAISADNSSRIEIVNNRFELNGYALRILGNCTDNTISNNDFLQNSFDVTTNSHSNFNDFTGNYWEEYAGYDIDRDGVGDIPFRPVKLFTYIIAQSPAAIILMRSSFIDLLNLAEKVTPVLTPETLVDERPQMKPINDHLKLSL